MSLFVSVNSIELGCPVIINLDMIREIRPVKAGGCHLVFQGEVILKVTDSYTSFSQFVLQPVSSDDIKKKIESIGKVQGLRTLDGMNAQGPETLPPGMDAKKSDTLRAERQAAKKNVGPSTITND